MTPRSKGKTERSLRPIKPTPPPMPPRTSYATSLSEHIPSTASTRPPIICLCGSTRFLAEERAAYFAETMKGNIVLSHSGMRTPDKVTGGELDQLHLRKIDLADEILVLNVNGYLGESTRNEIAYARSQSKPIRFLNPVPDVVDLQSILSTASING